MLREWRSAVRWADWRNPCASADSPRLRTDVTDAFIDRTPIAWTTLLNRAQAPEDRFLFENLYLLDRLRRAAPSSLAVSATLPGSFLIVRLVLAVAAAQIVCGLGMLGIAFLRGSAGPFRTTQIVLALAFATASLLLGAATARDRRGLFLLTMFAAAASAFARAAVAGAFDPSPVWLGALFQGLFPEAFAPAALWEFAVLFPIVQRFTGFDVLARQFAAAAWLLGSVLFGVNAAIAYHLIDHGPLCALARDDPGNAFWHLFVLAILPAAATILVRARRAPAAERRKVLRFAGSIAAGTAPLLVCGVIRMALPRVNEWFLTAISPSRLWTDRLIVGALTAMPILTTTALVADRPFERQALILKSVRDRLAHAAAAAAIVAPLAALSIVVYRFRRVPIADFVVQARAWLLLPCAAAGGLLAARARVLEALAARGVKRAAGHQERLAAALERVHVARSRREIGAVLSRELRRGAGAAATRILVARSNGGGQPGAFVDLSHGVGSLAHDTVLLAMLSETAVPLDVSSDSPLLPLIPAADRDWVTANRVALMAPLKRRDGTIAAIVVCGPRRGGCPFDRRDRWFISTLMIGAAAAWGAVEFGRFEEAEDADGVAAESRNDAAFECVRCGLLTDSSTLACRCGSETVVASLPRHLAGKFAVVRRIGSGGMGVVYLARDTTLDRDVALKTLPDLRDGTVARLRDEARAMALLNHGSLATIYGLELWRRTPVLVVEYWRAERSRAGCSVGQCRQAQSSRWASSSRKPWRTCTPEASCIAI